MRAAMISDAYLPEFQFSERHDCLIAASSARIIDAAEAYDPRQDGVFRFLIGLREIPMRVASHLMGRPHTTQPPFGLHNFTLLERRSDALAYGMVGQFWKMNYGLKPVADGKSFISFHEEETLKLVLSFSATPDAAGKTRLATETRVYCPNGRSRMKFLPYWLVIRPVSGLIRRRMLSTIRARSEGRA